MTNQEQLQKNQAKLDDLMSKAIRIVKGWSITSKNRTPQKNVAVGGRNNSDHMFWAAFDFVPIGMTCEQAFELLYKANLDYRQLILERKANFILGVFTGWIKCVHLSINHPANATKHEPLTQSIYGSKERTFLYKGNGKYWA